MNLGRLLFNVPTRHNGIYICLGTYIKQRKLMAKILSRQSPYFLCTSTSHCGLEDSSRKERFEDLDIVKYCKEREICLPENITEEQQKTLEDLTFFQQLKYLHYLVVTHFKKKNKKANKEKKREHVKSGLECRRETNNHLEYTLWKESLFSKICKKDVIDLLHHRLASAILHNQKVVLDLGFGVNMNIKECSSLANQIQWCITLNQRSHNPFHLTLCNVDFDCQTIIKLKKVMPNIFRKDIPVSVSSESYLNLYEREKLIYMTPNATDEMTFLDPNAIYILGGIVDCGYKQPLTFLKAQTEGIKTQKLPLDRYLKFKGYKTLNIVTVLSIFMELQETGDWVKALENVPKRLVQSTMTTLVDEESNSHSDFDHPNEGKVKAE